MPRYNHAFTIAFALENTDPEGNATAEELLAALEAKLEEFRQDPLQIVESAGAPYDTYEVEEDTPEVAPNEPVEVTKPKVCPLLKTSLSCEIDDLIDVVVEYTGKRFDEIEKAMFESGLYPEGGKTYVSTTGFCIDRHWVRDVINQIMVAQSIEGLYITEAI